MFSVKRKSQSGFSLVELMVVVAIIGILASIAIPSINKYMAKARQSEAKTNLSSLYTAEKAFFAEYNIYDSRFGAVAYTPEGQLRYNIGFTGGVQAGPANGYTTAPANTAIAAAGYCGAAGAINANGCAMMNGATGAAPPAIQATMCPVGGSAAVAGCTTNAAGNFRAGAGARIQSTSAATDDYWTIDDSKVLRNSQNGIR
ncbi:type IV pilin protein [Bdellovibrio bacteriovorus]|uniref:type IV pilin protein n=1 Tax=Bdellovibrio bacteriovorus TaxID=959 RepID=UPI0035A5F776